MYILAVTYIQIHPQIIHARDEGILSEVIDLTREDLLLEGIFRSDFHLDWWCYNVSTSCSKPCLGSSARFFLSRRAL